jgi:purine-nucleoside phosphorylase
MTSAFINEVFQAAGGINARTGHRPRLGMILGSGLSSLSESYQCDKIPYSDIPVLPKPTVEGHRGELYINDDIAICSGRFHYYEGHSPESVVSTVALLKGLGCEKLIVTNAAGGINRSFKPGDIMIITDHINMLAFNPLIGANPVVGGEALGPRFPDMSRVYHPDFAAKARSLDVGLVEGTYLATTGPSYETPAEIRAFAAMGADAVGMSTVPEAIFGRYMGMDIGGLSLITNFAAGLGHESLDHAEVVEIGRQAADRMKALVAGLVEWWLA